MQLILWFYFLGNELFHGRINYCFYPFSVVLKKRRRKNATFYPPVIKSYCLQRWSIDRWGMSSFNSFPVLKVVIKLNVVKPAVSSRKPKTRQNTSEKKVSLILDSHTVLSLGESWRDFHNLLAKTPSKIRNLNSVYQCVLERSVTQDRISNALGYFKANVKWNCLYLELVAKQLEISLNNKGAVRCA